MGSACSTLSGAVTATYRKIKDWLVAGWNMAVTAAKWLWKAVCTFFVVAWAVMRFVFKLFGMVISFGTCGESLGEIVEVVGGDAVSKINEIWELKGKVIVDQDPTESEVTVNQDPIKIFRENIDEKSKEVINLVRKGIDMLDDLLSQDEGHERMQKTEENLKDFLQSPDIQRLAGLALNGCSLINSSLA